MSLRTGKDYSAKLLASAALLLVLPAVPVCGQVGPTRPALRELPSSDRLLRCIVNLNGYAVNYPVQRWADAPLVTDLSVHLGSDSDERAVFARVTTAATEYNPDILIGRYISGGRAQSVAERFPTEAVDANSFPKEWFRDGSNRIDIENPRAADKLIELILAEADAVSRPVVFLDNIVHPSAMRGWIPWETTCGFLRRLRDGLHDRGTLLIANVAVASWVMSDTDVDLLAASVDGVSLEMPFHWTARSSAAGVARQIEVYRDWLDKGMAVILIAIDRRLTTEEERADEVRFIAAFAMAVRRPGDRLFVVWPFYKPPPEWEAWPQQFGRPIGDCRFDPATFELSRAFTNATIRMNTETRAVRIIPAGAKP